MKRLLAQIGIAYFSVLAIAFYLSEKATWLLLSLSILASAVLLAIRRTRRTIYIPAIALTVAVGCTVNLGFTYLRVIPIQEQFSGSEKRIEATLTDEPYLSYSKYYYRLKADTVDGENADCKLLLKTLRPLDIEPYDTVSFTADIHVTDNNDYISKGYYLTVDAYDDSFTVHRTEEKPLYYHVIALRRSLRSALDEYLPTDAAALSKAILIGDKYALDTQTKLDFRYAGASYFIVVSGMHFSIVCLLMLRLLKKLKIPRYLSLGIILLWILLYMSVTGFQPSVVRSGVMMIVYIVGKTFRRIGYAHGSLGLAGIVSAVVFTPYGAGDIGLILSFAATFAILTWSDPICRKISVKEPSKRRHKAWNAFARVLSASLAANILVFPISVFVFNAFSVVTLISSLLLYLPVETILILALPLCVFFLMGPLKVLSLLLSWPLYALCRIVLWVVNGLASLPFSYIRIGHDFFYIWIGVTIALASAVLMLKKRYRLLTYAAVLSAILLIGGTAVNAVTELNTAELTAYACGNRMTVGLNYHGRLYMLSFDADSYDAYRILNTLSRDYRSAELAVCSKKSDSVNYSRLSDKEFAIDRYLVYEMPQTGADSTELIAYDSADAYLLEDEISLTLFESGGQLASFLTVGDVTALVLPSKFPIRAIPEEYRDADYIILSRTAKDYDALTCGTLIVSNTQENGDLIADAMKNNCRAVLCTGGEDITIPMEG